MRRRDRASVDHLHRLFERQVARTPSATALWDRAHRLNYAELNARANQLARHLSARGSGPGQLVAMCLPRSCDLVVCLLAILKTGGGFVPLDPTLPEARKVAILRDSRPRILLAAHRAAVPADCDADIVVTQEAQVEVGRESEANLEQDDREGALFGVLYTSGVTGMPKGVVVPARAVLHHMKWMWKSFPFRRSDVALLHRSCMLISASWDYLGPLLQGVPGVVVPDSDANDPLAVWKCVVSSGVSHVAASPTFWGELLAHAERHPGEWSTLRLGMIGGEQVHAGIVRRWKRAFHGGRLLCMYGSTECIRPTTYETTELDAGAERVPVGRPLPDVEVLIVDKQFRRLSDGESGEICISGPCLANGYLNLPEATAQRFVRGCGLVEGDGAVFRTGDIGRIRPDGNLEVIGREDQQVKIRGYRVELGEVEAALLACEAVRQAVVVATDAPTGGKRLAAYFVADEGAPPSADGLRQFLTSRVADYMVPAVFVGLSDLPLTRSGKIDRNRLPSPDAQKCDEERGPGVRLSATERSLVAIWTEVFEVQSVDPDRDFFHLGGDSIVAARIASRVARSFAVELSLEALSSMRTIREVAVRIDNGELPRSS